MTNENSIVSPGSAGRARPKLREPSSYLHEPVVFPFVLRIANSLDGVDVLVSPDKRTMVPAGIFKLAVNRTVMELLAFGATVESAISAEVSPVQF